MEEYAAFVKQQRLKQNLSISELAQKSKCTYNAILYWEEHKRVPSIESAEKVLRALGVTYTLGK